MREQLQTELRLQGDIAVVSSVHEGCVFTASKGEAKSDTFYRLPEIPKSVAGIPVLEEHTHSRGGGCPCASGKIFAALMFPRDQD